MFMNQTSTHALPCISMHYPKVWLVESFKSCCCSVDPQKMPFGQVVWSTAPTKTSCRSPGDRDLKWWKQPFIFCGNTLEKKKKKNTYRFNIFSAVQSVYLTLFDRNVYICFSFRHGSFFSIPCISNTYVINHNSIFSPLPKMEVEHDLRLTISKSGQWVNVQYLAIVHHIFHVNYLDLNKKWTTCYQLQSSLIVEIVGTFKHNLNKPKVFHRSSQAEPRERPESCCKI